jgi:hypothetical protein
MKEEPMQQPASNPGRGSADYQSILRQLERLDERTQGLATRNELNAWRLELASKVELEGKFAVLTLQITRNIADIADSRKAFDEELAAQKQELKADDEAIRKEQASRMERFWMRFGPLITLGTLILMFLEFVTHFKIAP